MHLTRHLKRDRDFKIVSSSIPRHPVHGYAQVHASIYIYIYIQKSSFVATGGLHLLQFFCTCCTCENTAIYRTGAPLALKMATRACSAAAGALGRAVRACFGAAGALKVAPQACPGAASALEKAALACCGAASALKIAVLARSGAASALEKSVRACFSAASALKEAVRACCSRSLFESAGLGYTVL